MFSFLESLDHEVEKGRFREDLFWRVNVFQIHLPPLRDRREEIKVFARSFLADAGKKNVHVSPAALSIMEAYNWPGNVREFANVIRRAAILLSGNVLLPEHLPDSIRRVGEGRCGVKGDRFSAPAVSIEEVERRAIREALNRTDGNRGAAAKLLGISKRTLFYRLKRYGKIP